MIQISCSHGYFQFRETASGEVSKFASYFGLDVTSERDYWTFSDLLDMPDYAVQGNKYLDGTVKKTFSGQPDDIMRANGLVYDFSQSLMVDILSVKQSVVLLETGNYFISNGLIIPGSITDDGSRVTDYVAWFTLDSQRFLYSEIGFL